MSRLSTAALVGGYNLLQNRLLPGSTYVPANLLVTSGLLALATREGCTLEDLGLDPANAGDGLRLGASAAAVIATTAVLGSALPGARRHLRDERARDQSPRDVLYHTFVRFPLGTALFEEVAFRGVIEGVWRRDGATERDAAVASAVLFGLWHLLPTYDVIGGSPATAGVVSPRSQAMLVMAGALATGVASLGFSWMRRRSRSLLAPWLAHTAFNVAGYLASVAIWRRAQDAVGSGP